MSDRHIGEVVQVTGPVLDIKFKPDELPALLNAIEIETQGRKLVAEVAQQIGDNTVRCIAMNSTDGLVGHYLYKTKGSTDSNGDLDDVEIKQHSANETYTAVSSSSEGYSNKNPKTEGWFIKNGNVYIHSWDTTPQNGVTYYVLS